MVETSTPIESWEMLDILSALVEKNLATVETDGVTTRYRLLETVRQYVREYLLESEAGKTLRGQHAAYFCAFAEEHGPLVRGKERLERLALLENDLDNIRAALDWSSENPNEQEFAFRICHALQRYWEAQTVGAEGLQACKKALACAPDTSTKNRARCASVAGNCARGIGEIDLSLEYFNQTLRFMEESDEKLGQAVAYNNLAYSHNVRGDVDAAEPLLRKAIAIYETLGGEDDRMATSLNNLGDCYRIRKDGARARKSYERAIALHRKRGDEFGIALNYLNLGDVAFVEGDYETALDIYEQCLGISRRCAAHSTIATALGHICEILLMQERVEGVAEKLIEAISIRSNADSPVRVVGLYRLVAILAVLLGDATTAIRLVAKWEALYEPHHALEISVESNSLERARSMVDAKDFDSLWEEGQILSNDRATAVALNFLKSHVIAHVLPIFKGQRSCSETLTTCSLR